MRSWRTSAAMKRQQGPDSWSRRDFGVTMEEPEGQRSGGDRRKKGLKRGRGQAQELCDLDTEFEFYPVKERSWRIAGRKVLWFGLCSKELTLAVLL